jgi:hypothetical protein
MKMRDGFIVGVEADLGGRQRSTTTGAREGIMAAAAKPCHAGRHRGPRRL